MKRPRDGSVWLSLTPAELVGKLATLVPPPRTHGVRYHGVFAPHARLRSRVVPQGSHEVKEPEPASSAPHRGAGATGAKAGSASRASQYRVPWAELLKKVFEVDVLACPECGGRLRLIAFIAEAEVAKRILDHLGLASTGPPTTPARREAEPEEPVPSYDGVDPVYQE